MLFVRDGICTVSQPCFQVLWFFLSMVVPVLYVAYTAVMSAAGVCPALSVHRFPPSFSPIEQSGGYSAGVPPLPIPNREVKPVRADGTAMQCGRVGSRLFS